MQQIFQHGKNMLEYYLSNKSPTKVTTPLPRKGFVKEPIKGANLTRTHNNRITTTIIPHQQDLHQQYLH